MNPYYRSIRSHRAYQPTADGGQYPGFNDNSSFGGGAPGAGFPFGGTPVPDSESPNLPAVIPSADAAPTGGKGGFSLANLGELKGLIDRMGGLDGILGTMTKVQKLFSNVQQMAPMLKLLMGSIGKKSAASVLSDDDEGEWRPSRRRRRRKTRRRSGTGGTGSRRKSKSRRRSRT
ncbi:tyrosine protein kinase [Paenibacillus tarimensis]